MKFSRNLISQFIDISHIEDSKIYKTLNDIGLEVESMQTIDIPRNVVIGKVISTIKHPNADKLSICRVDIGNEVLQIVCGAKNVTKDQFVPVALVGAKIHNKEIKKTTLREIESCGMICSSTEINLPKIEDGIFVLDSSIGELVLGKELREYEIFNDIIFDVSITPNRGDCLSVLGIARDLAVVFNLKLKSTNKIDKNNIAPGIGRILNISFENNLQSSLYYKVAELRALKNPLSLTLYLALCDILCDDFLHNITRFSTFMTGVLINAYKIDAHKIASETKISLHIKKDSDDIECVYCDENLLSRIGIDADEKFWANINSKMVVLEASFIPATYVSEMIFSKNLKTNEQISYLSTRGSSPLLESGITFLCKILSDVSESVIYSSSQHVLQNYPLVRIDFTFKNINEIIGSQVPNEEITEILKKMNFTIHAAADNSFVSVNPPIWRQDINSVQDVAEEILRIVGINSITSLPQKFEQYSNIDEHYKIHKFRRSLAQKAIAGGFFECVHYLFYKKEKLREYGYATIPDNLDLINPISSDLDTIRSSLIPSLLDSVVRNQNYDFSSIRLFEIGDVYDANRTQSCNMAFVVSGTRNNARYPHPKSRSWNFYDFASAISSIIGEFSLENVSANVLYHPTVCANIIKNGVKIGVLGKLNPQFASKLEIDGECFMCEISFDLLREIHTEARFSEFSKYQASRRDITIVIDKNITFKEIRNCILEAKFANLAHIVPLDVYMDESLKGKISLSFRVIFQSMDATLEDVKTDEIVKLLSKKFKAVQR